MVFRHSSLHSSIFIAKMKVLYLIVSKKEVIKDAEETRPQARSRQARPWEARPQEVSNHSPEVQGWEGYPSHP